MRARMPLMFQVVIFMGALVPSPCREWERVRALEREARAAAAGGRGIRVLDLEGGADQVVDEVDLGACEVFERHGVDQDLRAAFRDDGVVACLCIDEVELVLKAGAAAALDGDAKKGACRLAGYDL